MKQGKKLLNALEFQKKVHKSTKSREISPVGKIIPKYYPMPKSIDLSALDKMNKISPIKYNEAKLLISNKLEIFVTPAMQ